MVQCWRWYEGLCNSNPCCSRVNYNFLVSCLGTHVRIKDFKIKKKLKKRLWVESRHCMIHTLKIKKKKIMASKVVCLGECSKWVWEECVFCCYWIRYSIHVCYMQVIDVEFNYALTDFMSTRQVSFWQTDIEVSNCTSRLIYFFLQFFFCPNLFYSYMHTCKNDSFLESWSYCINVLPLSIPDNFTYSEVCCSRN